MIIRDIYKNRYVVVADSPEGIFFMAMESGCGIPYWSTSFFDCDVKKFKSEEEACDFLKKYGEYYLKDESLKNIRVLDIEPRVVSSIFDKEAFVRHEQIH